MKVALNLLFLGLLTLLSLSSSSCDKKESEVRRPEEFMKSFSVALKDSKLDALWNAFPPSYRADLTQIVHEDFPKIHPDVWNDVLSMGKNLELLLTERREMLLNSILVVQNSQLKKLIEEQGDATAQLLAKLRQGSLARPGDWSQLDVPSFVAGDLSQALGLVMLWAREIIPQFGSAFDQLANNRTIILKEEPDRILARVEADGAAPQEQFFVKVENTWILQSFTLSWEKGLNELRESLTALGDPKSVVGQSIAKRAQAFEELAQAPDTQAFDTLFVKLLGE